MGPGIHIVFIVPASVFVTIADEATGAFISPKSGCNNYLKNVFTIVLGV